MLLVSIELSSSEHWKLVVQIVENKCDNKMWHKKCTSTPYKYYTRFDWLLIWTLNKSILNDSPVYTAPFCGTLCKMDTSLHIRNDITCKSDIYIYISGKQMRVKLVSQRKKTRIHIQLSVKLASRISLLSSLLNLNLCAGKLLCTLLHQLTCPHLETVWLVPRVHSYCCIKYCTYEQKYKYMIFTTKRSPKNGSGWINNQMLSIKLITCMSHRLGWIVVNDRHWIMIRGGVKLARAGWCYQHFGCLKLAIGAAVLDASWWGQSVSMDLAFDIYTEFLLSVSVSKKYENLILTYPE